MSTRRPSKPTAVAKTADRLAHEDAILAGQAARLAAAASRLAALLARRAAASASKQTQKEARE